MIRDETKMGTKAWIKQKAALRKGSELFDLIDRLWLVRERSYLWFSFSAALLCVRLLLRVIFITLELKNDKTTIRHIKAGIKADQPELKTTVLKDWTNVLHPESRRTPRWNVASHGAACVPVWSGAETCPRPPSPPPSCPFLMRGGSRR